MSLSAGVCAKGNDTPEVNRDTARTRRVSVGDSRGGDANPAAIGDMSTIAVKACAGPAAGTRLSGHGSHFVVSARRAFDAYCESELVGRSRSCTYVPTIGRARGQESVRTMVFGARGPVPSASVPAMVVARLGQP